MALASWAPIAATLSPCGTTRFLLAGAIMIGNASFWPRTSSDVSILLTSTITRRRRVVRRNASRLPSSVVSSSAPPDAYS